MATSDFSGLLCWQYLHLIQNALGITYLYPMVRDALKSVCIWEGLDLRNIAKLPFVEALATIKLKVKVLLPN